MSPAQSTIIFYALLLLGWGVLRGSLTPFPAWVDATLAFIALAGGLIAWALGWRSSQPEAQSFDGSQRAVRWRHIVTWIAMTAITAFLFLGPMSWISTRWAGATQTEASATAKTEPPRPTQHVGGNAGSVPDTGAEGGEGLDRHEPATGAVESRGLVSRTLGGFRELPRPWQLFALIAAVALLALLVWMAAQLARESSRGHAPGGHPAAARIPVYLHEFRRLCAAWGCALDAGSTIREAFLRLTESGHTVSAFEPLARYHYRVFYEDGPADATEERRLRRMLRAARRNPRRFRTIREEVARVPS